VAEEAQAVGSAVDRTQAVKALPKKKKRKIGWLSIVRTVSRVLTFIFLPFLFIDAYNIFRTLVQAIAYGTPVDFAGLAPQFLTLTLLVVGSLLLGRFFCGWMCAFGSFGDFMHRVGKSWTQRFGRVSVKVDRRLKRLKYVVLLVPVVLALVPGSPDASPTSPWDAFGMLSSSGLVPDVASVLYAIPIGFTLLLLITVGSFYIERFFCRYLCPLGAIFSLVSRGRYVTLAKPTEKCGSCRVCTNRCSMGIELYKTESVCSGECIQCMACVEACPRNNIVPLVATRKVRPMAAALVAVTVLSTAGLYLSGTFDFLSDTGAMTAMTSIDGASTLAGADNTTGDVGLPGDPTPAAEATAAPASTATPDASPTSGAAPTAGGTSAAAPTKAPTKAAPTRAPAAATPTPAPTKAPTPPPTVSASKYKDGTYQGTGIGYRKQPTTVSVTISGGQITAIATVSTSDSTKWYTRAFTALVKKILGLQAPVTDVVAGATYSSKGIDAAVADALSKA
jgi:polyferredoxin/uncharacterized protein with FMN-binding domain